MALLYVWIPLGFVIMVIRLAQPRETPLIEWGARAVFGLSAVAFVGVVALVVRGFRRRHLELGPTLIRHVDIFAVWEIPWESLACFRVRAAAGAETAAEVGRPEDCVLLDTAGVPQYSIPVRFYREPEDLRAALEERLKLDPEPWTATLPEPGPAAKRVSGGWLEVDLTSGVWGKVLAFAFVLLFALLAKLIRD